LLKQNVAINVAISLGYIIFSKDQKVPNWPKIAQSGHPGDNLGIVEMLKFW
jgi:hypothetical protein